MNILSFPALSSQYQEQLSLKTSNPPIPKYLTALCPYLFPPWRIAHQWTWEREWVLSKQWLSSAVEHL